MAELRLTVIVPAYNAHGTIQACIRSLLNAKRPPDELIIVDDSSIDGYRQLLPDRNLVIIELEGGPRGPAYARNRGVEASVGNILVFLDSDVTVYEDTLVKIEENFLKYPDIDALFGSYDDSPPGLGFMSQFKNLIHHYFHQRGKEEAFTFWAGCGAVRRDVFLSSGGFDENYIRPSIEDIELGYRLRRGGSRIRLCHEIQVSHLKKWTFLNVIKTDIFSRAVPWTKLIFLEHEIPSDLNLDWKSRFSALIVWVVLGGAIAGFIEPLFWLSIPIAVSILCWINKELYSLFRRKRGILFMVGSYFMYTFYLFYSSLTFIIAGGVFWIGHKFLKSRNK